ncbi:MAG: hypothetical protein IKV69_02350 [Clostridia bacterium]|nr:hypothetical protein [Clostridia bacterium]
MRVKKFKLVTLLLPVLALILCAFMFFSIPTTKVYAAEDGVVKVGIVAGGSAKEGSHAIAYPTDNKGEEQTVYITGYRGEGQVIYSLLKEDSNSYIFNQFDEPIEITEQNPKASFKYNFFQNGGVGTYRIKAAIILNGQITNHAQELKFTIQKPSLNSLRTSIQATQIGSTADDFPEYSCNVSVVSRDLEVDLSSYEVQWFYNCNGRETIYCGSGESIKWSPKEVGVYQLIVEVPELGVTKKYDIGEMTKNFSTYAIIGFSTLAAVLTGIVIGTTINKVRKERIW